MPKPGNLDAFDKVGVARNDTWDRDRVNSGSWIGHPADSLCCHLPRLGARLPSIQTVWHHGGSSSYCVGKRGQLWPSSVCLGQACQQPCKRPQNDDSVEAMTGEHAPLAKALR